MIPGEGTEKSEYDSGGIDGERGVVSSYLLLDFNLRFMKRLTRWICLLI